MQSEFVSLTFLILCLDEKGHTHKQKKKVL